MTSTLEEIFFLGESYKKVSPECFYSGDIFWVPKSGIIDFAALIVVERFSNDRHLGLVNMLGHKAGRKYVAFPDKCLTANGQSISQNWLRKNWDEWVALGSYEDAIFLRASTRCY